jgi:hypothetical protein
MGCQKAIAAAIDWLAAKPDLAGLCVLGRVESTRIIGEQTSTECRYVRCSLPDRNHVVTTVRVRLGYRKSTVL